MFLPQEDSKYGPIDHLADTVAGQWSLITAPHRPLHSLNLFHKEIHCTSLHYKPFNRMALNCTVVNSTGTSWSLPNNHCTQHLVCLWLAVIPVHMQLVTLYLWLYLWLAVILVHMQPTICHTVLVALLVARSNSSAHATYNLSHSTCGFT